MKKIRSSLPKIILAVLLLGVEFAAGCSSQVSGSNPNPVPDTWYGHNVQTIFNQSCGGGGCHINSSAYGVNLSSYDNVMNSYSSEYQSKVVIAGKASSSPLYDKVLSRPAHGYRMPYGRAPLSSAQIDTIKVWINRGAKNQ